LFLRVNLSDGGVEDLPADQDDWLFSETTDLAASIIYLHPSLNQQPMPVWLIAADDYIADQGVGVGEDVFFVGLFSQHPGRSRNLPIVRFGTISLMPDDEERLRVVVARDENGYEHKRDLRAYLAEARSWGGHSGSPVFVSYSVTRQPGQITGLNVSGRIGPQFLLGLVQGHYDIDQEVSFIGDTGTGTVAVNAGMAVVIPGQEILDLLMHDDFEEDRQRRLEVYEEELPAATPDVVSPTKPEAPPVEQNDLTREDFERTLRKVTRRVNKPEEPKRR
jgi:hypothetical protein